MRHWPPYIPFVGAVALYLCLGLALLWQKPGLQYDEALLVVGGAHLLNERTELPLPHDPDTWLCWGQRCLPLMTARYVGAVKDYLSLPFFLLFGSGGVAVRLLSIVLASGAVYGLGRMVGRLCSPRAGVFAAFALAIHPAFVDQSVFDNGTVAAPFLALGLLFVGLARYDEAPTWRNALWIGLAGGFGVWARANFTWVLFALVAALHLDLWRWLRRERVHAAALTVGLVAGSLPFWIYQVISRGGTFAVFGLFPAEGTWAQRLAWRGVMFAESLVSDREHRAIWGGGAVPGWQAGLFAAILVASLVFIARRHPRMVIATVVLYAFHFFSSVQVAEHHFVTVIPFAIAVVAGTGWRFLIPLYAVLALYWNFAAIQGLSRTGGVGQWSDAIGQVRKTIAEQHQGRMVHIVDWGLQNNLFVLSRGRLSSHEWIDEGDAGKMQELIGRGGLFLTGGDGNTFFGSARVFHALSANRRECQEFRERSGALYARLCDIAGGAMEGGVVSSSGLHPPEKDGWRWSKREFGFELDARAEAKAFALDLFIPPAVVEKLGPVTLQAVDCPAATYDKPGHYRYVRDVPKANPVRFRLDKAFRPGEIDQRELGVIVQGFSLRGR